MTVDHSIGTNLVRMVDPRIILGLAGWVGDRRMPGMTRMPRRVGTLCWLATDRHKRGPDLRDVAA
jgi:hypothetical protein